MSDCAACNTTAGCAKHLRFTCATCKRVAHWSVGAADDRPDDCSDCWAVWFGAMETVAAGLAQLLGGAS